VKSLVIVGVGLLADLWPRRLPIGAGLGAVSYLVAEGLSTLLKGVFDRPRPSIVDSAVHPLVAVPHNGSMPSTHAASAFAAALAVGFVHPRLRWPLLVLATLIALSRVWLGVHYPTDVIAGAALGTAIAFVVWRVSIRVFPEARPWHDRR
jgi:membrane-associated phospholipid phosphatase